MKRFLIALPLIAALSATAFAAGTKVANNSGLPIDELSAASPGSKDWGKNLMEGMGEGSLEAGMTAVVAELADGVYDLRVSAPDEGVLCYMSKVEIKDSAVELTPDMGKTCD